MKIRDIVVEVAEGVLREGEVLDEALMLDLNLGDEVILDNLDSSAVAECVTSVVRDYVRDNIAATMTEILHSFKFNRIPDDVWEDPVSRYVESWLDYHGADLLADVCADYIRDLSEDRILFEKLVDMDDLAAQIVEEAL